MPHNTVSQRNEKPLRILRYPKGSITPVFPSLLACDSRNGAKKYESTLRNGAKVFGQLREFLAPNKYIYTVMAAEENEELINFLLQFNFRPFLTEFVKNTELF